MRYSHISVAIPILAEKENVPTLIESLEHQTFNDFTVYICVNNPEGWSDSCNPEERSMYLDNQSTLEFLNHSQPTDLKLHVIDRSSVGKGWTGKQKGVGWARKVLFDAISQVCDSDELVVSLDADTTFADDYFEILLNTFNSHAEYSALAVPYYHPLSGDESTDRAMLRYEIYMRHYLIELLMISSRLSALDSQLKIPYAFTALGSAMVFPLWAYRRVGGITPLQGGEDYYLMQKFAKTGKVLCSCDTVVHPQGRISCRVPFGTGPAIAKGIDAMDESYPLYPHEGFESVAETYALFPQLYDEEIETPMSDFLRQQLKTDDIWDPLRKNFKSRDLFIHACTERVDGLRILQYLKTFPLRLPEEELTLFCKRHGSVIPEDFSFRTTPVEQIDAIRNTLFELER